MCPEDRLPALAGKTGWDDEADEPEKALEGIESIPDTKSAAQTFRNRDEVEGGSGKPSLAKKIGRAGRGFKGAVNFSDDTKRESHVRLRVPFLCPLNMQSIRHLMVQYHGCNVRHSLWYPAPDLQLKRPHEHNLGLSVL